MATLGSHANVYNTCLRILRQRGFRLWVEGELDENGCYPVEMDWFAEIKEATFQAYNPIELLGLVYIYELNGSTVDGADPEPYWWSVPGDNIREELLHQAFPFPEDIEDDAT